MAASSGVEFQPYNDYVPGRFFLPEIMGSGAAWLDYDLDGRLDLYLTNGCQVDPAAQTPTRYANQLFQQSGLGAFTSATQDSFSGDHGFGQGIGVGDFDADGFPDLFVANYGHNVLLHNNGDGTFSDITSPANIGRNQDWSSSVAWLDLNGDTWLDLYVVNYMDVTLANNQVCESFGSSRYCGPASYSSVADEVFLNRGDGTFEPAPEQMGLGGGDGRGLGVVAVDLDDDLQAEIYVANDMRPNFLFSKTRPGGEPTDRGARYADRALDAGCAVSDKGENEASMGIACGDFDGDLRPDLFLTHFFMEKNTLYHNLGRLVFSDDSRRARVAATSFERLGFGTIAADFDHNGTLDLFTANGHVYGPLLFPNQMLPQLLVNDGRGRFRDASNVAGDYFQNKWLGRAAAGADYDNDGDLDIAVTHVGKPVGLLRNDSKTTNHFVGIELTTRSRLPPVGGRVVITSSDQTQVFPVTAGGSYLAAADPRIICGLGKASGPVHVSVHWPSGKVDEHELATVDRYWRLVEGSENLVVPSVNPRR